MNIPSYRGYIGFNLAFGRSVPQHIQQQVIREYCAKNDLKFLLSATEYHEGSMMLDSLLEGDTQGIVFYSIGLMPKDKEARERVYNSDKDIRFAAENMGLNKELIETTFKVDEHARNELPPIVTQIKQA